MGHSITPPLRIISWNLTIRCPLKCPHCYSDAGTRDVSDPLSTTEAFGILEQIKATGNPIVILSGGEPMMREDLFEIARYGTRLGLKMAMGTSGYLFDENTILNLKDSGILSVAFSIDSADPAVHDTFRGCPGAWEKAVNAIRSCVREGIGAQINMTILEPDPIELDRVVALGKELGVQTYQIFIPVPTGRSVQENYERYGTYEELLKYIIRRYADDSISLRPTCIPQFRRVAQELGITHPRWGRGCLAGITYCRIYANGDVTPCPYLPAIANVMLLEIGETAFRNSRASDQRLSPRRTVYTHSSAVASRKPDCREGVSAGGCCWHSAGGDGKRQEKTTARRRTRATARPVGSVAPRCTARTSNACLDRPGCVPARDAGPTRAGHPGGAPEGAAAAGRRERGCVAAPWTLIIID